MGKHVARLTPARGKTLGAQLANSRARLFVGRSAELAHFERLIDAREPAGLWFVHGAGGRGKSTLLQRLRDRAQERRVPHLFLDARRIAPNPPAIETALSQTAGARALDAFYAAHPRPIVFIDSLEYWQVLDEWLRCVLVPGMPDHVVVIAAGRREPESEWFDRDAAGKRPVTSTRLARLKHSECAQYLQRRALDGAAVESLIAFARGNALALAMVADVAAEGGDPRLDPHGQESVYDTLLRSFIREARDPNQHFALDACAVAFQLDEALLANLVGPEAAPALYRWLAGLSFIATTADGLYPHDVVRDALIHTMDRRAPGRYELIVRAVVNGVVDRLEQQEQLTPAAAAHLGAQGLYALRQLPIVQRYLHGDGAHSLYVDRVRSDDDWRALAAMTRQHEGEESCAWFEFWRARFPDNVTVVRGIQGDARAYVLRLDMQALSAADRDADPLTRRLWQFVTAEIDPAAGETVAFNRFWVNYDYAAHDSPEKAQMLTHMVHHNMTTPRLRLTAQVFDTVEPTWPQQARAIGLQLVDEQPVEIGGQGYQIFYNDWLREPPMRYYRLFADRCIAFEQAMSGMAPAEPAPVALDYATFAHAVVDALHQFNWPAALAGNPLLASAAVLADTNPDAGRTDREAGLRDWLCTTIETLEQTAAISAVLRSAYLEGDGNQKKAAHTLSMSWSSYRRNLATARDRLVAELWRRELACRRD